MNDIKDPNQIVEIAASACQSPSIWLGVAICAIGLLCGIAIGYHEGRKDRH